MRERLPTRNCVHNFHLRVPGLDLVFEINGQYAYIDRLHYVFVEVFESLVLRDLLFKRRIQPSILDGDGKIASQSFHEFHILAGEEIAFNGLAESEDRDGGLLRAARDVVVQVKTGNCSLGVSGFARNVVRALEKQVAFSALWAGDAEEAEIKLPGLLNTE